MPSLPESMRSPTSAFAVAVALALIAAAARADDATGTAAIASAPAPAASAPSAPTVDQVRAVVAGLRSEPEFLSRHTERSLRWIGEPASQPRPAESPSWLIEMVRWLSSGARGLVWLLGAVVVAVLIVHAWRWVRVRGEATRARNALLPSHVGELDIRPESLPDDVAGAARALLARGQQRAALSLLYRGALSRLVHGHGVQIAGASTEGECKALAADALPATGSAYFTRLVQAWQMEVYAGRSAGVANIAALCDELDLHITAAAPAPDEPQPRHEGVSA